jgi:hypothetical protein
VSVHGPPGLCFESLKYFTLNAETDPDQAYKNNANLDPQRCLCKFTVGVEASPSVLQSNAGSAEYSR